MLLHEIITTNDTGTTSILVEELYKYKKSLNTYYTELFNCPPVLMVTDVFNAAQYAIIVPSNEFGEAIETYLNADTALTEEDKEHERELIGYQSIMMQQFIQ